MEIKALIKKNSVTTKTTVDDFGATHSVTSFRVEVDDLDTETLSALALGAHEMRILQFELIR